MPRIPRVLQQGADGGRRASGTDFGGDQGLGALSGAAEQVAETARTFAAAQQESQLTRSLTQATDELNRYREELDQDPELETQEERFRERVREVRARAREKLGGSYAQRFELSIGQYAGRVEQRVREGVRARQIDRSRAGLEESLQSLADQIGRAETDTERILLQTQADDAIQREVESGTIRATSAVSIQRSFRKQIAEGDIREELRIDPGAATLRLMDPKDPLVSGLSEAERQVWIDRGVSAFDAEVSRANAADSRAQAELRRQEKEFGEALERQGYDLLAQGDLDSLDALLATRGDALPPSSFRYFRERLAAGGGFGDAQSNRNAFVALSNAAARGEDIRADVDEAFRSGLIDQGDRERLIKSQDDRRFGDAETFLRSSLKVGEDALGSEAFIARARSAEALRSFTDWKLSHPDATRDEALAEARALVRDAAVVELGEIEAAQLAPRYAVRTQGKRIDVEQTGARTFEAFQSGEIDRAQLAEQLRRLEAVERAQEAAAEREAAKTQAGR